MNLTLHGNIFAAFFILIYLSPCYKFYKILISLASNIFDAFVVCVNKSQYLIELFNLNKLIIQHYEKQRKMTKSFIFSKF